MSEAKGLPELQKELLALLRGGQAHASFEDAVKDFPKEKRGVVPEGLPYSAWQIVEHIRITQRDILDFSSPPTGGYQPMEWPKGYWPETAVPASAHAWDASVDAIEKDRKTFEALITKPGVDLYKPFRWGEGQNLLREAMLIADHTSYHTGELIVLRRLLGIWHK
ncbi:MAG: DinB family protein [Edaphobacter sp.]|uniref:DinB family protein n=1 Tax=Edaphobacter sp. TaxID=1934404 RepID=UPI0023909901|nr:DinB family protein [Edaphobacter sp.]MDE1175442.1 DinB family protein [Edaphobacter sp.]